MSSHRSLWSMRNFIHINLCVSLILAQLTFVIGVTPHEGGEGVGPGCRTAAVIMHYLFLVSFMWMLMEGVVLYVALVRVFVKHQRRYMFGFFVFSYGGFTVLSYGGSQECDWTHDLFTQVLPSCTWSSVFPSAWPLPMSQVTAMGTFKQPMRPLVYQTLCKSGKEALY